MTEELAVQFLNDAIYTTMLVSGPILLVTLVVGLLISIFQAVTSINEMTLTFIPKIISVIILLLFILPWMIKVMETFTINVFYMIPALAR
ncbi:MAG: flagellar biosynthesis protein FliQ [Calditrichaeota bacterium]|nr:flagellar biosynthesis protein FliQ [Calditrichota bacterium]MCB0270264.1 flagellar biosynthesis protein FliQ [Calditrichota bacterium]MCB0286301.1 flagellar biosynthesis protein FliQ [Calditrichota bacterium]MCB0301747.1 flagellar biosynthesis protein FliQ [Calditrichota bacterium]MCB9068357.1 flagellar biosynthesis protein FliQ [Calditrichia bacterium]